MINPIKYKSWGSKVGLLFANWKIRLPRQLIQQPCNMMPNTARKIEAETWENDWPRKTRREEWNTGTVEWKTRREGMSPAPGPERTTESKQRTTPGDEPSDCCSVSRLDSGSKRDFWAAAACYPGSKYTVVCLLQSWRLPCSLAPVISMQGL